MIYELRDLLLELNEWIYKIKEQTELNGVQMNRIVSTESTERL